MSKDAKIGFVVVSVVVGLLLVHSFRRSGLTLFNDKIGLLFTQVYGLRAGDPVTIGGVPAGRVVEIDFAPKEIQDSFFPITGGTTLVRALVELDGGRKIPKESTYSVRIDLNGRRWLDVTLSPSNELIEPNESFFAESEFGQDDPMQRTLTTFTTLAEQTEGLREQLKDPDFLLKTKDTASNLRFYSRELVAASAEAPKQLEAFESGLDRQEMALMEQIKSFDEKTQEVSRRMIEMAPQLSENLEGWAARLERQGDKLASTLEVANVNTLEYQRMLDSAIAMGLKPETTQRLLVQAKQWNRKLQEYRYLAEDLHSLTSDPTIREDLKQAIDDMRGKGEQMNERIHKLEERLKKLPFVGSKMQNGEDEATNVTEPGEPSSEPIDPIDPEPTPDEEPISE